MRIEVTSHAMEPNPESRVEASALARLVQFDKAKGKPDEAAKWRKELEASKPQSPPK